MTARRFLCTAAVWCAAASLGLPAGAHDATFPIAGKKLSVRTDGDKASRKFSFKAQGEGLIRIANHDPATDGASVVVVGRGKKGASSTGLIPLDAKYWSTIEDGGDLIGYRYSDPSGSQGGVTKVVLKDGKLQLKAKGRRWKWKPAGKQKSVSVIFRFEEEEYCAEFAKKAGAKVQRNEQGMFVASAAEAPLECPAQVCGNGQLESGEECDDGNLAEKDGCRRDCTIGICKGESFDTTFEAVQSVIFDSPVYRCSNDACHGAAKEGELDLRAEASWESLVGVASDANPELLLVFPGEPAKSQLFEKLEAKQQDRPTSHGSPMPVAAPALSFAHLDGMYEWIRAGAPRDISVLGTQDNFGTCLPEPEPLKIPVPDPPLAGTGVQLQQTPWPLPGQGGEEQGEDEVCMATYYDASALVPESAKIPCPAGFAYDANDRVCSDAPFAEEGCTNDDDCEDDATCIPRRNAANDGNECFAYHRQALFQDPQSHHSIIHIYTGAYDQNHESWGPWTTKTRVSGSEGDGEACDPSDIDPAVGFNPGCSGDVVSSIACVGYGPPDANNLSVTSSGGALPSFSGSQEPYYEQELADTVYSVLPVKGIVVWNSHAFNLTQFDSTMSQYLNLDFAEPEDQVNPARGLFDSRWIFSQYTLPFQQQEICATSTLPQGARLFNLSSHTHRWGVRFRTWLPPNTPCRPACPTPAGPLQIGCSDQGTYSGGVSIEDLPICGAPPATPADYFSTEYSDPLQLDFDEPLAFDGEAIEDRTLLFCSLFDNGSTHASPAVKQFSTSPTPPSFGSALGIGGPCKMSERACMDGPNKGELCNGTDEASFCQTEAGADDGECDACPVRGGVTTEDEMLINLGTWYLPAL